MRGDVRLDELAPSLFAVLALHPVFIELRDTFIWVFEELWEVALHVLEDLVV